MFAQHFAGRLYARAGLPVSELSVAWVAAATDGPTNGGSFLEQAQELLENETFEMAVVAAQIHFEAQVNALVRAAAERDGSALALAVVAERRSWTPQDTRARPVIDALLGIQISNFGRWKDYRAHLIRRNAVVHEAQAIAADAAAESLGVIEEFWLWINESTAQDGRRRGEIPPRLSSAALPVDALFEDSRQKRSRGSGLWALGAGGALEGFAESIDGDEPYGSPTP